MRDTKVNSIKRERQTDVASLGFEPLLTVAQAAQVLGLDEQTLYGWIHEGKFEGLKLGARSVRIRPEAVRALIKSAQEKAHTCKVA